MSEYFLNYFSKLKAKSSNLNSTSNFTTTDTNCNNGNPPSLYEGYGNNSWQVLYSIWNANQTTIGAEFTDEQSATQAPVNPTTTGPANIFIIRHGEKTTSDPFSLNNNGAYRACKLIEYVNKFAQRGTPISYIITCLPCYYNTPDCSERPVQTVSMASFMLNIPLFMFSNGQDFDATVNALFDSGTFAGLNVLICWEHSSIQGLLLKILNKAGSVGRLPNSVITAQPNPNLYGDEYCYQFSILNGNVPDGTYLCTTTSPSYNPVYDPLINTPIYVGTHTQFYPYWSNYNFSSVYCIRSIASSGYIFNFTIENEEILTCFSNCELKIGLYQPLSTLCTNSYYYYNKNPSNLNLENQCEVPVDWLWTPP